MGHRYRPSGLVNPTCGSCGKGQDAEEHLLYQRDEIEADIVSCPRCGTVVPLEETQRHMRTVNNAVIRERVCKFCVTQQPCPTNEGIHTEIYDGDSDFARSSRWPSGLPKDGQHGVCSRCIHPMMWDRLAHRWVDWNQTSPVIELANLMEAFNAGQIDEETYYAALEDRARA